MSNNYDGKVPQYTNRDKPLYTGPLGTPVYADLTFKGGTYTNDNGRIVTITDVTLVTILLSVSQAKRIVTTQIQGREGSIKEYIGSDDYQVTINGILTGGNGRYPAEEMRLLKAVLDITAPIPVICRYLQAMGIYHLVIKDYALDQQPGGYSQQNFTINAMSDAGVTATLY